MTVRQRQTGGLVKGQGEVIIENNHQRQKRITIALALMLSVVVGPFALLTDERSLTSRLLSFITLIAISLIVFCWCYFDGLDRHRPMTRGVRLLIILFGLFALCYYLLVTRGPRRGMISIGITLLITLAAIVLMALSATVVQTILDISDPG